jgi:superoxide dismutase, Cu-Zn family
VTPLAGARSLAIALISSVAASCGDAPSKENAAANILGFAAVTPKNGSTVRGVVTFTQRGDRVYVTGQLFELFPGAHSIYIHSVGNCSSPNAASAGPVWNLPGNDGKKRTGDLPQIFAGTEGRADISFTLRDVTVNTGKPNDVIGHAVVVHADLDRDPTAEFGVRNGWLACGVIKATDTQSLKDLL